MSQYRRWHCCRIIKTMTYMLYLIHIETCGYYAVSEYEGLNSNRWVYNAQGNAYDAFVLLSPFVTCRGRANEQGL